MSPSQSSQYLDSDQVKSLGQFKFQVIPSALRTQLSHCLFRQTNFTDLFLNNYDQVSLKVKLCDASG